METNNLDRREMLKRLSLVTGYVFTAGATSAFLAGCKGDVSSTAKSEGGTAAFKSVFNSDQLALISDVAERIIPKTDTPGAKDAKVEQYINEAVSAVFKQADRERFVKGLDKFNTVASEKYKKKFTELDDNAKDDVLKMLVEEWKQSQSVKDAPPHIFKEMRDLTVTGFCTSEIGAKQFLVYEPVPGPYKVIDRSTVKAGYAL